MKIALRLTALLTCLLVVTISSNFAQSTGGVDLAQHPVCGFDLHNHSEDQTHPDRAAEWDKYLNYVLPYLSENPPNQENILTIPVVFHIIHEGEPIGTGRNISDQQVIEQLDILNEDFSALNASFNQTPSQWAGIIGTPNIQFCLAQEDPNGNASNGIDRQNFTVIGSDWQDNNINSEVKPMFNWDPSLYMNIYILGIPGTTANGGVVGFANRPFTNIVGSNIDGIVADYRWVGSPNFPVSGFRTITHEAGHYLGLPHPFNGESCSADDGIADTPNMEEATLSVASLNCANEFPTGPVTCTDEHLYVNYMDYVNENCYTSFTNGQINVMRSVLQGIDVPGFSYGSRVELLSLTPTFCTLAAHDAGVIGISSPTDAECTDQDITPMVTIRNFGTADLTQVEVNYQLDDNTPVTFNWTGLLEPGDNEEVSLPAFTPVTGFVEFKAYTNAPNGMTDELMTNDTSSLIIDINVPLDAPLVEDLETTTGFPTPTGIFPFNPDGDPFFWQIANGASAYGIGGTCLVFDNSNGTNQTNPFGTIDALITPHFDMTSLPLAELTFDLAYAQYDDTFSDTLIVLAAVDCATSFNQVIYVSGGADLATAPATTDPFVPTNTQWKTETIDLSAFATAEDISFAIVNVSGWGNRLFLDNINIGADCALALTSSKTDALCHGECTGSATVMASGGSGFTYQWDAAANSQTTATAVNLCAGTYSVTVTDGTDCVNSLSVTVEEPAALAIMTNSTDLSAAGANDGTASAAASGGTADYTYAWSNGNATSMIENLAPGTYEVTVTDMNGCTSSEMVTINDFDCGNFSAAVTGTNISCNGDGNGTALAAGVSGTGPFTYLWSNDETTASIGGLQAGVYTVTITDENDCPAIGEITITEPDELEVPVTSTSETAAGANNGTASVFPQGGTMGYSYAWSNNETSSTITNLAPGDYTVTVTDANMCTATNVVTVNSFDCGGFSVSISSEDVACFEQANGSAEVTNNGGTGPFEYAWSNGAVSFAIIDLTPGTYTVTVTDANDCSGVLETVIIEPAELLADVSATNETGNNANDGTATATPNGGTDPYSYQWNNNGTTPTIENLPPGDYTVTVLDANQCTFIETVTVEEFGCALAAEVQISNASCPNIADGIATVMNIQGGTGTFTFAWSNGDTDAMAEDLLPGTYTVTVTDGAGCPFTETIVIEGADDTNPTILVENVSIALDANGLATISAALIDAGSSDNCGMVNTSLDVTSFDCSNVGENEVIFTATDGNGNTAQETVIVTIEDNIPPVITSCPDNITIIECDGEVNYAMPTFTDNCSATATMVNGFPSGSAFPAGETEVVIEVTDVGANTVECSFIVTVDYDLSFTYNVTSPSCPGDEDGFASISPAGQFPPFFIQFETGGDPVGLSAGLYNVTIVDNMGCSVTGEVEVEDPELLSFSIVSTTPSTNGQANGQAVLDIQGATEPYNVSWTLNGTVISTEQNPTNLLSGDYEIEVTGANNCTTLTESVFIDNIVGVEEITALKDLKIFPNPTSGQLYVVLELKQNTGLEMQLLDITGKAVLPSIRQESAPDKVVLESDLSDLANGIYWIRLIIDNEVLTRKVVVVSQ